jgi:hypothetical protein
MSLQTIPQDIFNLIYRYYLDESDIFNLRQVCKLFEKTIPVKKIHIKFDFNGNVGIALINRNPFSLNLPELPALERCVLNNEITHIIIGVDYEYNCVCEMRIHNMSQEIIQSLNQMMTNKKIINIIDDKKYGMRLTVD